MSPVVVSLWISIPAVIKPNDGGATPVVQKIKVGVYAMPHWRQKDSLKTTLVMRYSMLGVH